MTVRLAAALLVAVVAVACNDTTTVPTRDEATAALDARATQLRDALEDRGLVGEEPGEPESGTSDCPDGLERIERRQRFALPDDVDERDEIVFFDATVLPLLLEGGGVVEETSAGLVVADYPDDTRVDIAGSGTRSLDVGVLSPCTATS